MGGVPTRRFLRARATSSRRRDFARKRSPRSARSSADFRATEDHEPPDSRLPERSGREATQGSWQGSVSSTKLTLQRLETHLWGAANIPLRIVRLVISHEHEPTEGPVFSPA